MKRLATYQLISRAASCFFLRRQKRVVTRRSAPTPRGAVRGDHFVCSPHQGVENAHGGLHVFFFLVLRDHHNNQRERRNLFLRKLALVPLKTSRTHRRGFCPHEGRDRVSTCRRRCGVTGCLVHTCCTLVRGTEGLSLRDEDCRRQAETLTRMCLPLYPHPNVSVHTHHSYSGRSEDLLSVWDDGTELLHSGVCTLCRLPLIVFVLLHIRHLHVLLSPCRLSQEGFGTRWLKRGT